MANCWVYLGAAMSIAGAIIAARPTLISNAKIEKMTNMEWGGKFEHEEQRDALKSTRLHAGIGVALAIVGQIVSLVGS